MRTTNDLSAALPDDLDDAPRAYYRVVLQHFRGQPAEVATVDELVAVVLDQHRPDADETGVAIHLHHVTLPKLAEVGCIEYDARSNTARYRGHESATL